MQSLIVIACKLLRIIYTILKNGAVYDPKKMLTDIKRPDKQEGNPKTMECYSHYIITKTG